MIPLPIAWTVAEAFCARRSVRLVRPDSLLRRMIVPVVALSYKVAGSKVTEDQVRQSVSVTLPGIPGPALELLKMVPPVDGIPLGAVLYGLCSGLAATTISLSPAACADGGELLTALAHEGDHADGIAHHGILSTIGYVVPEARAGSEAVAYGQTVAGRVWLLGEDPLSAGVGAMASLGYYALDAASETLADDLVGVAVRTLMGVEGHPGIVPGTAREIVRMLQAAGVGGLPVVE